MVHQYNPRIVQAQMEGTSPGFWTILVLNVKLCRPTLFFYDSMEHVADAEKCNSSCFFLSTRSHFLPVTPEGWRVRTGTTLVMGRWLSEVGGGKPVSTSIGVRSPLALNISQVSLIASMHNSFQLCRSSSCRLGGPDPDIWVHTYP